MLDGTWIPVTAELSGQQLPDAILRTMKLIMFGSKYVASVGGVSDQGLVKINARSVPAVMDITGTSGPNEGRTIRAIYELSGDRLTVCYALDGDTRPAEFKTQPDSKHYLVTYKRAYP
ncbi:MAG TPA: TIGR03067 domain-containing protein [Blastocatellia bacterium]|nr:TIGR03067 domain-containing protein [Blastocatellia bacterium]